MSTSEPDKPVTDFDRWLADEFATTGAFTAAGDFGLDHRDQGAAAVLDLSQRHRHRDRLERDRRFVCRLGTEWDGASFFPVTAPDGGPLDNPTARLRLHELEARLDQNPLVLNEGHFFDKWGRRLKVEETELQ